MAADNIVKLENINAPRFRNEWSPTTVVALLTLIGMIIGIGAMWQRLEGRIDLADRGISQLNTNVQVLDARTTGVPNIEYRVTKTEEAIAAGVCFHLRPEDSIGSYHRGHGHCLAKGADPGRFLAEVYGRVDGYCRGKGGETHVAVPEVGVTAIRASGLASVVPAGAS